jgi:predicted nucleic acid-binding protein
MTLGLSEIKVVEKVKKKRLYLDVCTLCRPFDDQNIMRIRLETDAFYLILQSIQNGTYEMIVSPIHLKEIEAIEGTRERLELMVLLNKFGLRPSCDLPRIRKRAEQLYSLKFGVADAAHVAFAEETANILISCDSRMLKKCRKTKVNVLSMSPIEFCVKEDLR